MCAFNVAVFLLPPPRAVIISVTVNSLAAQLTKTYNYYYYFYYIWCKQAPDDPGLFLKWLHYRTFLYTLIYKYIHV